MIEKELQVNRRLQDADPFKLQEKILRKIGYGEGEINSITAAAHDTLLGNTSLLELVERRMEKQLKLKAQDIVVRYMTKNIVLPLGFSRPKCSGVLVYTGDDMYTDGGYITDELSTRLGPVPMFYANNPQTGIIMSGESSRTTHQAPCDC